MKKQTIKKIAIASAILFCSFTSQNASAQWTSGPGAISTASGVTDVNVPNGSITSNVNIHATNGEIKGFNVWATNFMLCNGDIESDANIRALVGEIKGFNLWATNFLLCNGDIQSDANIHATNGEIKGLNLWATNQAYVDGSMVIGDHSISQPSGYKLYVKQGILTEKIKVAMSSDLTNWSDFVFADDYKLKSLSEVENYIGKHKHLPEIPSTAEVHANGIDLAEIDAKLLQKIEELTLYVIQQQKEIDGLKKKLNK